MVEFSGIRDSWDEFWNLDVINNFVMEVVDVQQIDAYGLEFEVTFSDESGKDVLKIVLTKGDIEEIALVLKREG